MPRLSVTPPASAGAEFVRLFQDEGTLKELSARSGVSIATLRNVAVCGRANSYVTALAIEQATDGRIKASNLVPEDAKGVGFYSRDPARALLLKAMEEGKSVARLLAQHGASTGDLWNAMNAPKGARMDSKDRIAAVLVQLQLSNSVEKLDD